MGIFSRLTDIINANLNSVLDRAVDPEKMVRQMIHEMEDTLVEVRSNAARMIAERKSIERRRRKLGEVKEEWQRKAELAVTKHREDLARAALIEKTRLGKDLDDLDEEVVHLDEGLAKYEEDIAKLEDKLREARAKQKTIVARQATATSRLKVRRQTHDRRIDDALVRFEQMERRLEATESEVEAFDLGRSRTLADEIDELAAENGVEQELAELKARLDNERGGRGGAATETR
jgi:phage shock protein A